MHKVLQGLADAACTPTAWRNWSLKVCQPEAAELLLCGLESAEVAGECVALSCCSSALLEASSAAFSRSTTCRLCTCTCAGMHAPTSAVRPPQVCRRAHDGRGWHDPPVPTLHACTHPVQHTLDAASWADSVPHLPQACAMWDVWGGRSRCGGDKARSACLCGERVGLRLQLGHLTLLALAVAPLRRLVRLVLHRRPVLPALHLWRHSQHCSLQQNGRAVPHEKKEVGPQMLLMLICKPPTKQECTQHAPGKPLGR